MVDDGSVFRPLIAHEVPSGRTQKDCGRPGGARLHEAPAQLAREGETDQRLRGRRGGSAACWEAAAAQRGAAKQGAAPRQARAGELLVFVRGEDGGGV